MVVQVSSRVKGRVATTLVAGQVAFEAPRV
jgi:hypothetical protein